MDNEEINRKLKAIEKIRLASELALMFCKHQRELYGFDKTEKDKASLKAHEDAHKALNEISDVIESELAFKVLKNDTGI